MLGTSGGRTGSHQSARGGISVPDIGEQMDGRACDDALSYGALAWNARPQGPHLWKLMRRASVSSEGLSPKISVKA